MIIAVFAILVVVVLYWLLHDAIIRAYANSNTNELRYHYPSAKKVSG